MEELTESELKMRYVGRFLKEARAKANLTQADVSKALEYTSSQFVSNWERGLSLPPMFVLPKLAEIYGLAPQDIVDTFAAYQEAVVELRNLRMQRLFQIAK